MGRIVRNSQTRSKIIRFLIRRSNQELSRLERIGPEYCWVLRHLYSAVPCSVGALQEIIPWSAATINGKRDQALYLLGAKHKLSAQNRRAAERRLLDFRIRQRFTYLLESKTLTPGDRKVVELALEHGSYPHDIDPHSPLSRQCLIHALGRLAGVKPLQTVRPGELIRRTAFSDLLQSGVNQKAAIEAQILEALDGGKLIAELAAEWEIDPTPLRALLAEVRRELAVHPKTRARFAKLERKAREDGRRSIGERREWLNATLLPLYRLFRRSNRPFSRREKSYLRLRSRGVRIASAAKRILGISHSPATIIERAFLGLIKPASVCFPESLPLPPFTRPQRKLIRELKYAKL